MQRPKGQNPRRQLGSPLHKMGKFTAWYVLLADQILFAQPGVLSGVGIVLCDQGVLHIGVKN